MNVINPKYKLTVGTAAQTEEYLSCLFLKSLTFSTTLDTGYLVLWPTTQTECKIISPVLSFGAKPAHTSHTSFVVTVDPEGDSTTQQEQQEEEAARDSSRDASNGGSTQAATY